MTDEAKQLFLADRVRALAAVILTRRDDLTIPRARFAEALAQLRRQTTTQHQSTPRILTPSPPGRGLG